MWLILLALVTGAGCVPPAEPLDVGGRDASGDVEDADAGTSRSMPAREPGELAAREPARRGAPYRVADWGGAITLAAPAAAVRSTRPKTPRQPEPPLERVLQLRRVVCTAGCDDAPSPHLFFPSPLENEARVTTRSGAVYFSIDGRLFVSLRDDRRARRVRRGADHSRIVGLAAAGRRLVVISERSIALSLDGGRHWRERAWAPGAQFGLETIGNVLEVHLDHGGWLRIRHATEGERCGAVEERFEGWAPHVRVVPDDASE